MRLRSAVAQAATTSQARVMLTAFVLLREAAARLAGGSANVLRVRCLMPQNWHTPLCVLHEYATHRMRNYSRCFSWYAAATCRRMAVPLATTELVNQLVFTIYLHMRVGPDGTSFDD